MTGGEFVLRFLVEQGVTIGFGIPGALNAHLYDALPRLAGEFRHILVRHELGGAWMADGRVMTLHSQEGTLEDVFINVAGPAASQ